MSKIIGYQWYGSNCQYLGRGDFKEVSKSSPELTTEALDTLKEKLKNSVIRGIENGTDITLWQIKNRKQAIKMITSEIQS